MIARVESPPVDVFGIADSLGIAVERADLGEDCSGVLVRSGDKATIGVNWTHHESRQRFTVADEIGHFRLHDKDTTYVDSHFMVKFRNQDSGTGTRAEEREVNRFAAALLMPARVVRAAYEANPFDPEDQDELELLTEQFGVSQQAMTIRLSSLGLFEL